MNDQPGLTEGINHPPDVLDGFPDGFADLIRIPRNELIKSLGLRGFPVPRSILESVKRSNWYSYDDGRILIEIRNPRLKNKRSSQAAYLLDFDDTFLATSIWHEAEWGSLSKDKALKERGIKITPEKAKLIYDLSKINLPKLAEKERRYTPGLNLYLLTEYARAMEKGYTEDQAWETVLDDLSKLCSSEDPEAVIGNFEPDEDICRIFMENSPRKFIFQDFVQDMFTRGRSDDLKVIASRGKIEGPLGQVYKLHASGVIGKGADMVIYTNDLKSEAIGLLLKIFPDLRNWLLRIYDDNPTEIQDYFNYARLHGFENLEIIRVRHPGTKRKNALLNLEPAVTTGDQEIPSDTIYDVIFPLENSPTKYW